MHPTFLLFSYLFLALSTSHGDCRSALDPCYIKFEPVGVSIFFAVQIHDVYNLDCYSCAAVPKLTDCKVVVQCPTGSICHTTFRGNKYELGCLSASLCTTTVNASLVHITGGPGIIVGRATPDFIQDSCSQCCETANCNNKLCQVQDGGWSDWGTWEKCSRTCDGGIQKRSRNCTNPLPSLLGTYCIGDNVEVQQCAQQACVDGGWSDWGSWEQCSRTCDGGVQKRSRTCTNPSPSLLGHFCVGDSVDVQQCAFTACADGGWSDWTRWGGCSRTCEGGLQTRYRSCSNPAPSALGSYCSGEPMQVQQCLQIPCIDKEIGFSVSAPENISYNASHIGFSHIIYNNGSDFNETTGEFAVTVPGLYYFSLTLFLTYGSDFAQCEIYRNDAPISFVYVDPQTDRGTFSATNSALVHLDAGDTTSVQGCNSLPSLRAESTFTGFLVRAD